MSQRSEGLTRPNLSSVTHWLIHQAAHRAPEALSSRLKEEWLADLASRATALSRLRFAIGCCWATVVIVNDCPPSAAVAGAVASAGGSVTLVDRNFGYFSLRSATLFLIAGLHAALFYGLITTLSHTHSAATPPDLQNRDVTSVPREKIPFTFSTPELDHWTIYVPKTPEAPPRKLDIQSDVMGDGLDKPTEVIPQPLPPDTPTHVVQKMAGGPGAGFPETADFYPSASIRLGEEGMTIVQACVDRKGRLTSEPTAVRSSGSARLDEAATKLARAGSGHYRASSEDGQPVNSCYPFGIRFQLKR